MDARVLRVCILLQIGGWFSSSAVAQIFIDNFDTYPTGTPTQFLDVWPNDGCANARVDAAGGNVWSAPNSLKQAKNGTDNHNLGVRHIHAFTAVELQGAAAGAAGANAVQGTDDNPLVLEYFLDLGSNSWWRHNRFIEITCGFDRAPTQMITVDCPEAGKTRRHLDPNGDGQVHGSIAAGVISMADMTPCGDEGISGDEQHSVDHLVVYDGRFWRILAEYPLPGTNLRICKRWNRISITIRTDEIDIRLISKYNAANDDCEGTLDQTVTLGRAYPGPFAAVVMGGIVDDEFGGCIEQGSFGTNIPDNQYVNWIDNIYVHGGEADVYAEPCPDIATFGACCEQADWGTGTCAISTEGECAGTWLGTGIACGECDYCPDPFADTDRDGDVDVKDFGRFQNCITGLGGAVSAECECFDRDGNPGIGEDDFALFAQCAGGPSIPADPTCDD